MPSWDAFDTDTRGTRRLYSQEIETVIAASLWATFQPSSRSSNNSIVLVAVTMSTSLQDNRTEHYILNFMPAGAQHYGSLPHVHYLFGFPMVAKSCPALLAWIQGLVVYYCAYLSPGLLLPNSFHWWRWNNRYSLGPSTGLFVSSSIPICWFGRSGDVAYWKTVFEDVDS